jgi:hypothetical protein
MAGSEKLCIKVFNTKISKNMSSQKKNQYFKLGTLILGGYGADTCDGGPGIDSLMFTGNPFNQTGVFIDLFNGKGYFADAEGDTYVSIENVFGSEFDDIILDSLEDNVINGEGGNDILATTLGEDTLNGGTGSNTFVLTRALGTKYLTYECEGNSSFTDDTVNRLVLSVNKYFYHVKNGNTTVIFVSNVPMKLHFKPSLTQFDWFPIDTTPHLTVILVKKQCQNQPKWAISIKQPSGSVNDSTHLIVSAQHHNLMTIDAFMANVSQPLPGSPMKYLFGAGICVTLALVGLFCMVKGKSLLVIIE